MQWALIGCHNHLNMASIDYGFILTNRLWAKLGNAMKIKVLHVPLFYLFNNYASKTSYLQAIKWFKRDYAPKQGWTCFVRYPKIINTFLKNNMINLKHGACKSQACSFTGPMLEANCLRNSKCHQNFSRSCDFSVIYQTMQNSVWSVT